MRRPCAVSSRCSCAAARTSANCWRACANACSAAANRIWAALRAGLDILRDVDLRGELQHIKQPTLIIAGERDKLTPPEASHYLAQTMPSCAPGGSRRCGACTVPVAS